MQCLLGLQWDNIKYIMTFLDSIETCFKKSFELKGRASKSEFWWFFLFYFLAIFILIFIKEILAIIFVLIIVPASICVTVRRLHDQNKSGYFYFLGFIPYIGGLILLFMCAMDGTRGKNKYGAPPTNIKTRLKKRK